MYMKGGSMGNNKTSSDKEKRKIYLQELEEYITTKQCLEWNSLHEIMDNQSCSIKRIDTLGGKSWKASGNDTKQVVWVWFDKITA